MLLSALHLNWKISSFSFLWNQLREQNQCDNKKCKYISQRVTRSSILPIEISDIKRKRGNRSVFNAKDAILKYFQSSEAGIDKTCENCSGKKCSKHFSLHRSPKFILIQFKRFKASKALRSKNVIFSKINAESEPFSEVEINSTQGVQRYKVFATIEHIGKDLHSGHYVSYLHKDEKWYVCDDLTVKLLQKGDTKPTSNIYILLLKKIQE